MEKRVAGWKTILWRFSKWRRNTGRERDPGPTPRILGVLPKGFSRVLLKAVSEQSGWTLTLSETPGSVDAIPPIIIYDRELSPMDWRDFVSLWTKRSPRPYVILLSPNTDANLWEELQRIGGSDILRSPLNEENLRWAIKRAWLVWRGQQQVRFALQTPK